MESRASVDVLRGWITRVERDAEEAATAHRPLYRQMAKQSCEPWKKKDDFSRLLTAAKHPLNRSHAASSLEEARGLLRAWARFEEEVDEASVLPKAAPLVLDPSQAQEVAHTPPRKLWTTQRGYQAETRLARHASENRQVACEPKQDTVPRTYKLAATRSQFSAPTDAASPTAASKRVTKPSVAWILPAKDTCKQLFLRNSATCTATKLATRHKRASPSIPPHTETRYLTAKSRYETDARRGDSPLAECRASSPCSDIEPRQSTRRPQPESAPTVRHRAEADELRKRRTRNIRVDALQQAWSTRRMRLILQVWRTSAYSSSQEWRVALARARKMCFRRSAGHVLHAWAKSAAESAALKKDLCAARNRRILSRAMHAWNNRVLRVAKATMAAELNLRCKRLACVWSGWMRAIRLYRSEREAAEISRELEAARRKERSANRWFKRRVESAIFVRWLEAATALREERTMRERHKERRRKVLVLEARIAAANEHSNEKAVKNCSASTSAGSQTASCATEESEQNNRSADIRHHPLQRHATKKTGHVAAPAKIQPAGPDRRYGQRLGKLDARATERRTRRKALELQTQARVKQQKAVARAAHERKEEEDANNLRTYQVARAEAEAAAEASRALARHQSFVARLHFERACLRWRGTVPWRQYVVAARLVQCKAKRWYADGLIQRTWSSWLNWQTQCRRRVLEARQQAFIAAIRAVERFRCRMPLARWVSSVQDLAILGAAVTTKHRILLAQQTLGFWRTHARRETALGAQRWQHAVEFARRTTERQVIRVWLRKLHVWRQGEFLEQRCDKKWDMVRGWISGGSPTAPKPSPITAL